MEGVPSGGLVTRRTFLRASTATVLAAPLFPWPAFWEPSHRFFTDAEAATVNALCDRIIPADEDPGAAWAGVVQFIDRKLAGYHRRYQPLYRAGLQGVSESAFILFKKDFLQLTAAEQDELLRRFEAKEAPGQVWTGVSSRDFFDRLVDHTLQGFYGGPRHGGNRDEVSWHMLGLATPPLRSRRPLAVDWS